MEFTIGRDEFLKALQRVQGVVSSKGPLPILANVLIEAGGSGVTVSATNLEMGVLADHKADVTSPGKVTVQAKKLHDIVKELPSDDISVKVDDDGRCRIACRKSKFNLATINADEFPAFPEYDTASLISLEASMLADMIRKTSFSISQDETRLTLNGAFFEVNKTHARMVATDGHRLAYLEREGAFGVTEPVKAIIARKAVTELTKILADSEGTVKFCQQDNHIVFSIDSVTLGIRLIEGAYPNYEQVIPKEFTREATIGSEEFIHCLRRVVTLADDKSHMVRLSFSNGKVELISEGGEIGEARDEVAIEYEGEELSVGLNALYLLDVMNIIDDDKVVLKMQDQLSPVMAQPPSDQGLISIVMPMRL